MTKQGKEGVTVKIQRFDPSEDREPYYASYEVPMTKGLTVLSAMRYIYENLDHSLAYYDSCRIGKCAGCHVKVNGHTHLACNALVTGDIVLEPQGGYTVIRDLVVDKRS